MRCRLYTLFVFFAVSGFAQEDLGAKAAQILKKNCVACHGASLKMSGLDLRTREAMVTGGSRGPAITPANSARSLMLKLVTHDEKPTMPPGQKLADADIEVLRQWIDAGAVLPEVGTQSSASAADDKKAAMARMEERPITPEERKFWAFQQPVRRDPPKGFGSNPVDAFLRSALEAKGLRPSPRADARTLIRRAYLDVTGLPPSPEEVADFVRDPSPKRWAEVVERLLASPHYGERWGRHWLDLVRYADSGGFERDYDWHNMWRYRDYVVKAFNSDKPYDEFIREQLAGDEIAPESNEAQIATGYLRLGLDNNIKDERTRMDELDDLVATTSLAFAGMTTGCARCHNHKFDPIPQKDYYQMQAVFFPTKGTEHPLVSREEVAKHRAEVARIKGMQKPLEAEKKGIEEPYRKQIFEEKIEALPEVLRTAWRTPEDKRTEGQKLNARQIEKTLTIPTEDIVKRMNEGEKSRHTELVAAIKVLEKQMPAPFPTARAIAESGREAPPSYFLHRGAPDMKGSAMKPGILTVAWDGAYEFPAPPADAKSSWRRRGLAEWLASPKNPLTARVMVNRIWQHHFGEGLVRTPSNFGKTGERPTHPELLDWLATEFVQSGWSVKAMHRLMLLSDTYQMASDDVSANVGVDPDNRMLWRMPRQRLSAEILRDQMLAVAGNLDRTVGGPSVFPYIDPDLFQSSTSRTWPGKPDNDPSTWRRSLYVFMKRSIRYPMFEAFDQPDATASCARRNGSTVAPQALLLMNNAFVIQEAKMFAERVEKDAPGDRGKQVDRAWELALGRPPADAERRRAVSFLESGSGTLPDLCQLIFNLNEFTYRQ